MYNTPMKNKPLTICEQAIVDCYNTIAIDKKAPEQILADMNEIDAELEEMTNKKVTKWKTLS